VHYAVFLFRQAGVRKTYENIFLCAEFSGHKAIPAVYNDLALSTMLLKSVVGKLRVEDVRNFCLQIFQFAEQHIDKELTPFSPAATFLDV